MNKLTSPQLKILAEMDEDLRNLERISLSDPQAAAQYMRRRMRSGEVNEDQIHIAAILGHPQAKAYVQGLGIGVPEWRDPLAVASALWAFCDDEQMAALRNVSIELAHDVVNILENMIGKPSYQNELGYNLEYVQDQLNTFEEALSFLRSGDIPGSWQSDDDGDDPGLMGQGEAWHPWQDYGAIHNWSSGYAHITEPGPDLGDYRSEAGFKNRPFNPPRGPGGVLQPEVIAGMTAIGSFLEAFNIANPVGSALQFTGQHNRRILSTAIERLAPIVGIDRMRRTFLKAAVPNLS